VAFLLDAATYLVSAGLLSLIHFPRSQMGEGEDFFRELRFGLGYLVGASIPLVIVVGDFLTVLTTNVSIPAEVFLARETFDAGAAGYGLLVSMWGAGMVAGSALMVVLGDRTNLMALYFLGIFAVALALTGVGLSPTFALALAALTVAGASNGVENVVTDTILQKRVPEALLGRVFSVRFLSFSTGEALAYLTGGLIVDAIGPRPTYLFTGIATALAGLFILFFLVFASARDVQER
jgi:MFS family permease